MPPVPTVDASADVRSARQHRLGAEHLVLGLILLSLEALAVLVATGHAPA